jgi:hypothetical protein
MNGANALRESLARARSRRGVVLLLAFTAVGFATVFVQQSLLDATVSRYLAAGGDPSIFPEGFLPIPLSLGVPYELAALGFATVAVFNEYLMIVTLRTFAGEALLPAATRRVGRAVLAGVLVGIVVRPLVVVGLLAFVVPGAFLAVSLLFAHARVAIEDDGPTTALREAWALAEGRRFEVFSVVTLLAALYLTPLAVDSFVDAAETGLLVRGVLLGPVSLLSSAIVARAYADFTREPETAEDPYAQPLGPDDLPEP